ncbi:DUF4194 domain-containing protein [Allochromatium palmeri]|uniref:DUF4194 domain-containing protein n=1 Tax=Allochromatium palmeri TaxID=231048 RepID=A0A6N8EDD6_9GAMM|nr:DUF4194 domain-containing protein [Allochromatium palmeri]MTW20344.1 DUF4194 domain-containing protein [Allochromatium palmeri]
MDQPDATLDTTPTTKPNQDLSRLLIGLLKGVLYRESDEPLWAALLTLQSAVRDTMRLLDLELVLDEAEGYAFLKSRDDSDDDDEGSTRLPRLIARRPLSFPVSLLLALLRKKLLEFDAGAGDTRLVLSRDEIVELVRVFLPEGTNEARLIDQIDTHINKVVDLGFLHRLKPGAGAAAAPDNYEVKRILKAFVDAQWLSEFDARLAVYRQRLMPESATAEGRRHD